MAVPEGAKSVNYFFSQYGQGVEINTNITVILAISGDVVALAMEAAMGAFVASLEAQTPGAAVYASRTYEGALQADPWPPAKPTAE